MRWLDQLKLRLRTLFRRDQVESELRRELEFHLQELIAENIARGMPLREARYRALRSVGGITQIEEQCREQRGLHLIETSFQDVRYALRSFRKSPAFTAVAVLSLALGTGANTAIFSLIDSLLLSSLPVKNPKQLMFIKTSSINSGSFQVSRTMLNRDIEQMQKRATQFEGFASAQRNGRLSVTIGGATELAGAEFVSGNYLELLGIEPQLGRAIVPSDDTESGDRGPGWPAMITDAYWQRRFGRNPAVLGEPMTINTIPFVVVGVLPRGFSGLSIDERVDMIAPAVVYKQVAAGSTAAGFPTPENDAGDVVVRLRSGSSPSNAAAELTVLFHATELAAGDIAEKDKSSIARQKIELEPAAKGSSFLRRRFAQPLRILMTVVVLVMLLACANLAGLLLAKATAHQKEVAVRLSLGSSRSRILRQVLTESFILSLFGCAAGLVCGVFARTLTLRIGAGIDAATLRMSWNFRLFLFLASMCVLNAFLFGILPALRATKVDPNEVLKSANSSQHAARLPLGRVLVTAQLAICVVLVVSSAFFLRTLRNLYSVELGFDRERLLLAAIDPQLRGLDEIRSKSIYKQLLAELRTHPSVVSASLMDNPLLSGRAHLIQVSVPGYVARAGEDASNAWILTYGVGPGYSGTLTMPLVSGRDFTDADNENGPPVVIINEAMAAHYFGTSNPIGKRIGLSSIFTSTHSRTNTAEIVGVVRNAHYFDVRDQEQRAVFLPAFQLQQFKSAETLLIRTRNRPEQMFADLRALVRRIDPNLSLFDVSSMNEQLANSLREPRLLAVFSTFFGALALVLSAIGLYGVLAYGVTKRTGEIGIRMALGADRHGILKLILGETSRVLMVGIASGLALAWAAVKLIKSMLYGVTGHDIRIYATATVVLTLVALGAALLPARRAIKIDPMAALRYE